MFSNDTLLGYYTSNFTLKYDHDLASLTEIEDMLPFERDAYIFMINQRMEEKRLAKQSQQRTG